MRYTPHPSQIAGMSTDELRSAFLIEDLFALGRVTLRALDLDRVILGGVVPLRERLELGSPPEIAAEYFTERRELGVLNVGGNGRVIVDGQPFELAKRDALYIGRGSRAVAFESQNPDQPARFYLVSYPAHAAHPTTAVPAAEATPTELGTQEAANRRRLSKYFHADGVKSAQLVMGVTELHSGSVWNTMPPHTHQRRTEVYLYFDIPEDAVVFHFLGEPGQTRNLVVRDGQVALSPSWSIHAGCGTSNYSFCWAMGGENQVFSDMQAVEMRGLR